MSQSVTIGRVTADLEPQMSANGNNYVRFTIAENIGHGKSARTQYLQVWAWGDNAKHLINGKVKKGSLLWVSGSLELEAYQKRDGTADKRLKIILDSWGYIPIGKPQNGAVANGSTAAESAETDAPYETSPGGEIDGDRENLPE
jgi:single-stranded DNA-binding protein